MKIATFNANSIRARLDIVIEWLTEHEPDVLAIQEIKCENDKFPTDAFEEAGWQVAVHGQKSYNGVAIVSRSPIKNVRTGFGDPTWPEDCRIITAEVDGVEIVNTYVPNGTSVGSEKFEYKLRWLPRFGQFIADRYSRDYPVVWLGDINIAPTEKDLFDAAKHVGKVGFHPDEHEALRRLMDWGWIELFREFEQDGGHYTFWEFVIPKAFERNLGWRIDHIYAPPSMGSRCRNCVIDKEPRGYERPSDHTFVIAEFEG